MTGIRCDANSIIASGHMMRCLTIAKEIVRQGQSVTFFVADKESEQAFFNMSGDAQGIDIVVLGSNWQDMESELPVLEKELIARDIDTLLVDSYRVTPGYFSKLKELCRVAYIDDLNADAYPVDILINYSGYYKDFNYEEAYKDMTGHDGSRTRLLLGLGYAPLREQFYQNEDENKKDVTGQEENVGADAKKSGISILLASGGADAYGMLLGTLKGAAKNGLIKNGVDWHVVVGALCRDVESIEEFAAANPGVHIHRSVSDMAGLMRRCDLAVCAAGTMLTESAAVSLPVIFYQVADNQKYNVDFFGKTGGMLFAGNAESAAKENIEGVNAVTDNICRIIREVIEDDRLNDMRAALLGLTDGRGAVCIAKALLDKSGS